MRWAEAPIAQGSVFPVALAWLLVGCLLHGLELPKSDAKSPPIIVDSVVVTDYRELGRRATFLENPSCNGGHLYREHPMTVSDFVGGKVKTIRVLRSATFLPGGNPPSAYEVQQKLRKVWRGKFQSSFCQVAWAEATFWSIEAIVEFEDGMRSPLITDGVHVALQDHDGKSAFFRLLPAAQ